MKMNFTVDVRADVITGRDDLSIGALSHVSARDSFEVLNAKRHIAGSRRRVYRQTLRQVKHPDLGHKFNELICVHVRSLLTLIDIQFFR